ncbi:hypothetical protein [Kocuria sp.]|uniref:hypothetical protein n=1 Tax=Kocuria sp. TaxID=1871328 RepID=UPI0026DF82F9|nr:hypothetical protein [Kocuria sp.]MDO5619184.1 hypothetical protein [Kocuria sp.]
MTKNYSLRTPLTVGVLALTASFGLAGCVPTGNGGSDPQTTETTQTQTAEPTTQEPTATAESTTTTEPATSSPSADKTATGSPSPTSGGGGVATSGDVDTTELAGDPISTVTGKGGDTVDVPEHDGPIVVVFENTSAGQYTYIYATADHGGVLSGVDTGETSVNFVDPYSSYRQTNTKSYTVEGDSDETFTMSFYEVDALPTAGPDESITGEGFGVFKWEGDEDVTVKASHEGSGNFIVRGEDTQPGGQGTQYTFNEIGSGYGYLDIGAGEYYVVVEADGAWSFEPSSPEEADADSGSSAS